MVWDDEKGVYHYPCPCGDRFEITRRQLADCEDIATCPSCSLIIRVIFDPVRSIICCVSVVVVVALTGLSRFSLISKTKNRHHQVMKRNQRKRRRRAMMSTLKMPWTSWISKTSLSPSPSFLLSGHDAMSIKKHRLGRPSYQTWSDQTEPSLFHNFISFL